MVVKKRTVKEIEYGTGIARKDKGEICETSKIPQRVITSLEIFPIALDEKEVKIIDSILDKNLEVGEKFIKACRGLPRGWASGNKGVPCVDRNDILRYYHTSSSHIKLPSKTTEKISLLKKPKIVAQRIMAYTKVPHCKIEVKANYDNHGSLTFETVENIYISDDREPLFYLGLLNSSSISFFLSRMIFTKHFETSMDFDEKYIHRIRFPISTHNQQTPLISLVTAIIQKKKEYHAISQNLEDYIEFKDCRVIRLEDFIKNAVEDFSIVSSIKVKNDNFDALRVKIEGENAVIEYGIKRKVEEYEIEEDKEIKGKYTIEWHEAGCGKIKDSSAVEFLAKVLKDTKNFSKAKQKSIWQKIAEVKVPEFSQKVKEGFLRYKSAMKKAKELDEEITKIDRAIDRLAYDLYGLTEEERKVVEKSVWGDRFEEIYKKLPSREPALKLAEEIKNEQ
ncbi:hypothetical protein M1N84_03800 [Dehalococcoidia bacterium]|nr:hypothetical protein [Dehalococcoidia bacterium]